MRSRFYAANAATLFLTMALTAAPLRAANRVYRDLYSLHLSAVTTFGPSSDQEAADGGQVVSDAQGAATDNDDHAMLWKMRARSGVDLNPSGFSSSAAIGTDGRHQVGDGIATQTDVDHALLWFGTAASAIDLNPTGFQSSIALGTNGTQEVGSATKNGTDNYALLWRGSAKSAIILNPNGFTSSVANGTNGRQQIGDGYSTSTEAFNHALLWSGSANSVVDLNPTKLAGFRTSFGMGIGGSEEVGYGIGKHRSHQAILWHGTAASAVDLNPNGFSFSIANGTNGAQQVGAGFGTATGGEEHGLLWSDSAKSFVDLGALLPSNFTKSVAFTINAAGDVFGYAEKTSGAYDAIEWRAPLTGSAIPEPGTLGIIGLAAIALLRRRPLFPVTPDKNVC